MCGSLGNNRAFKKVSEIEEEKRAVDLGWWWKRKRVDEEDCRTKKGNKRSDDWVNSDSCYVYYSIA